LLNSYDQDLRLGHFVDIRKQSVLEEADEPKPEERTLKVLNLTEELELTESGIEVFEDINSNDQRAATAGQALT
jgi:hypothetical protein